MRFISPCSFFFLQVWGRCWRRIPKWLKVGKARGFEFQLKIGRNSLKKIQTSIICVDRYLIDIMNYKSATYPNLDKRFQHYLIFKLENYTKLQCPCLICRVLYRFSIVGITFNRSLAVEDLETCKFGRGQLGREAVIKGYGASHWVVCKVCFFPPLQNILAECYLQVQYFCEYCFIIFSPSYN